MMKAKMSTSGGMMKKGYAAGGAKKVAKPVAKPAPAKKK
jgi:hypothetical protein